MNGCLDLLSILHSVTAYFNWYLIMSVILFNIFIAKSYSDFLWLTKNTLPNDPFPNVANIEKSLKFILVLTSI